jgi:hypothetical protein
MALLGTGIYFFQSILIFYRISQQRGRKLEGKETRPSLRGLRQRVCIFRLLSD